MVVNLEMRTLCAVVCMFIIGCEAGLNCPPPCTPPPEITGCTAYDVMSGCPRNIKDISSSEADCGCYWQAYIQSVEPNAKVIFTNEGNQCYIWAAALCSYLETKTKQSVLEPLRDILTRLERLEDYGGLMLASEIAKTRKRSGLKYSDYPENKLMKSRKKTKALKSSGKGSSPGFHFTTPVHVGKKKPDNTSIEIESTFVGKHSPDNQWMEVVRQEVPVKVDKSSHKPSHKKPKPGVRDIEDLFKAMTLDITDTETSRNAAIGDWLKSRTPAPVSTDTETRRTAALKKSDDTSGVDTPESTDKKVKTSITVCKHLFDVSLQTDEFKLLVFMIILLLNILVVVVLIFCRGSGKEKKTNEASPVGDLDPQAYHGPNPPRNPGKHATPFDSFLHTMPAVKKESSGGFATVNMEPVNNADLQPQISDNRYFRGSMSAPPYQAPPPPETEQYYESINGQLDMMYEEPMSPGGPFQPQHYTAGEGSISDGNGSSPTKYFPSEKRVERNVSFATPTGRSLTIQDQMSPYARPRKSTMKGGAGTCPVSFQQLM